MKRCSVVEYALLEWTSAMEGTACGRLIHDRAGTSLLPAAAASTTGLNVTCCDNREEERC